MAYPVVSAAVNSQTTADATSHTVTLPVAQPGDLLLVFGTWDGTPTISGWPSGWNSVYDIGAATIRRVLYYKFADGTEGTSLSLTSSASEEMQARALRITNAHVSAAPESAQTTGTSVNPNSPTLTTSWTSRETLWFSAAHIDDSVTTSVYPANFTLYQDSANSGGASGVTFAIAGRTITTATQDPGAFTINTSKFWFASTVAIRPDYRPTFSVAQAANTLDVTFTDTSDFTATSWSWNFGDGTTSTLQNPVKTYAIPGVYTVTLTVGNGDAATARSVTVVSVPDAPPARPDGLVIGAELLMNEWWRDVTCQVLEASWNWGAGSDQGVMTQQDAGSLSLRLVDPDRILDPQNAVGPFFGVLDIGTPIRLRIDGYTAFRGRVTGITHDLQLAEDIDFVTITAEDELGTIGRFAADNGGALALVSQSASARVTALLDDMAWPAGQRDIGTGGETLQAVTVENEVWPAIIETVISDGGRIQVEQDGTVHYRNRATAWAGLATTFTLGCTGDAEMESLALVSEAGPLTNSLTYGIVGGSAALYTDATSIATYGTWTAVKTDLLLTSSSAAAVWGAFVVNAQRFPSYGARAASFTLTPATVAAVATARIGDRWRVLETHHGPDIDLTQRLLGLSYTVGPTRVVVSATMGSDYGLSETLFRTVFDTEAEWENAPAYGNLNTNGNSGRLKVEDRVA